MSFQEKNFAVSLVSSTLILGVFLIGVLLMIQGGSFDSTSVIRLWVIVIVLSIIVTILGTILTHIVSAIIEAVRTNEEPEIEDIADERDKLIDLKGTRVTYVAFSVGVLLSMITFALGRPPLVMFTLIIFFGILAQMAGDVSRLYYYRRGF
jgi:hypothetical protein